MPHKRAPRKRQTRLDFSPLPDSSPAKQAQPAAVRNRAAGIVVSTSPSGNPAKRQKTAHHPLPTPDASSATAPPASANNVSSSGRMTRSFMHAGSRLRSSPDSASSPPKASTLRDQLRDSFPSDSESDEPVAPLRSSQRSRHTQVLSSDDEDDAVQSTTTRRRPVRPARRDDKLSGETPRRLRRRKHVSSPSDSDEEDDDDNPASLPTPRRSSIEEADLQEDLDFLAPSPDAEDTPRVGRSQSTAKTVKQKALEALKKKRQRQQQSNGRSSQTTIAISDDDDDDDDQHETYATEDEEPTVEDWEAPAESEEDWLVDEGDDDEQVLIPVEFRLRTMKPKELFKIAVEWFVQKKINPAFDRDDNAYQIAFSRLSDFVNGMGGSKYQSSAWTPVFRRSLLARPVLQESHCPGEAGMRDRCDACNRSGHPATYEVMFTGKPYEKSSLEEFSDDDDDTGQETELPDASKVYYIGKFCMRNARVAHQLHHWRFHLNEWIVDYLKEQGYLTAAKILKRDGQSTSRRAKAANKIVEKMEESGEIKNLYRDFKHELDAARHGEGAGSSHFDYDSH